MIDKLLTQSQVETSKEFVQFQIKWVPTLLGGLFFLIVAMIIGHVLFDVSGEIYITLMFYILKGIWIVVILAVIAFIILGIIHFVDTVILGN